MFIVGVLIGPALAVGIGDLLWKPGGISVRWRLVGLAVALLGFLTIPIFAAELKFGIVLGLPAGLLLTSTPFTSNPVDGVSRTSESSRTST